MRLLAIATATATFLLLLLGGIVHGTGSSLACPDWPLCYGSAFPEMTGGVLYEHSHRLLATAVGAMTVALAVLSWRRRRVDRALWRLGLAALATVLVQGVLGGITVLWRLPTAVSTAHLAVSMVFFGLLITIARHSGGSPAPRLDLPPTLVRWLGVATGAVYVQIVLGGLVRHTGAGLACLDLPFCEGQLWPGEGAPVAKLHMVHRWVGVAVALLVIAVAERLRRTATSSRAARVMAGASQVLVLAQVALGALSVWSMLGLAEVTAHLGVAAVLLGNLWALRLMSRAHAVPASDATEATVAPLPSAAREASA